MRPTQSLNAAAISQLTRDVVTTPDHLMNCATPGVGWTVADLIVHMNEEHEAITETVLGSLDGRAEDPRDAFAVIAARWTVALSQAGPTIMVPKAGVALPTDQVLAIHFVDMLVHRWDLTRATGRDSDTDAILIEAALPIAQFVTDESNPYGLVGLAYDKRWPAQSDCLSIDNLAALLGRDPDWFPHHV